MVDRRLILEDDRSSSQDGRKIARAGDDTAARSCELAFP
jgi:hypothetical protein